MKWISVHQTLPEEFKDVLIIVIDQGIKIITGGKVDTSTDPENPMWSVSHPRLELYCDLTEIIINDFSSLLINDEAKVTHWMPLPELPEC